MKPSGGQSGGRMPPKQPWGRGLGKGSGVRVTPWQWDPGDTPPRGQRLRCRRASPVGNKPALNERHQHQGCALASEKMEQGGTASGVALKSRQEQPLPCRFLMYPVHPLPRGGGHRGQQTLRPVTP